MVAGHGPRPVRRAGAFCISLDMNGLKTLVAAALLTLPLAGCGADPASPPTGQIDGRVVIEAEGIDGISVALSGGARTTTSGGGYFAFTDVEAGPLHHHHQPASRGRQLRRHHGGSDDRPGRRDRHPQLRRLLDPHREPDGHRDHGRPGPSGHHRNRLGSRRGAHDRRTRTGSTRSRDSARAPTASSSRASRRPISRSRWSPAPYH